MRVLMMLRQMRMRFALTVVFINLLLSIYVIEKSNNKLYFTKHFPTKLMSPNKILDCSEQSNKMIQGINSSYFQQPVDKESQVPIYIITPTYKRSSQLPDMTMLSQTLMHVPNIHWIVIEDAENVTGLVDKLLQRSGLPYIYLAATKSEQEKKIKSRGCAQRNKALSWIKDHVTDGIIYFADDDNSYDLRLFTELRKIKQVGILPTGHLTYTGISSPVVVNGTVKDFVDVWPGGRKYPVEMASIGINIKFWLEKGAPLFKPWKPGFLETKLLEDLITTKSDLEPLADNCTEIYVWHTQTVNLKDVGKSYTSKTKFRNTNIPKLMNSVVFNK